MNLYEDRFQELQRKNQMIKRQVEIIQENKKPIIPEIYPELPITKQDDDQQPQDINSFLKSVEQQRKQINSKIEKAQMQFEKQQKEFENKQKKKQSKIQQNKIIPTKDQLQIERKQKEDARLNDFIQNMVNKYGQYLKNEEKELTLDQKQEYVQYLKDYEIYQMGKSIKQNNSLALQQKERQKFQIIGNHSQQSKNLEIQMDFIKPEKELMEKKQIKKPTKQIFDKALIFKILDEKCARGMSYTLEQNKDKLIKQIFKYIDRESSGYVSKEELLEYFNKFQVFIDVFGLIPREFQIFVTKVKAIRRGLLNLEEFKQILDDPKLHDSTENVQKRIQNNDREQYLIPNKDDHLYKVEGIIQGVQQEQFVRDPQVDYKQLEKVQEINKEYQDLHFPLKINPNVDQMKIVVNNEKKSIKQKQSNDDFVKFSNQMYDLQNAYNEGKLDAQKFI